MTVIDADGHIIDDQDKVREHLEPPYDRRNMPLTPLDAWDTSLYGKYRGADRRDAVSARGWLEVMDRHGLERAVLYPTLCTTAYYLREADYAVALCRAYNNYFAEEFARVSPRLKGVALLPMQDPDEAAKELRRAVVELEFVGAEVLATGLRFPLGDRRYDPVYAEAERLGTTIVVHGTRTGVHEVAAGFYDTFTEVHCVAFPFGVMRQFTSLVFQGVPERFPRLTLGFAEIGATWLPYWLDRMDEHWELRGEVETPALRRRPSEVVRERPLYFTFEAEETLLPETIRVIGEDRLAYATDFPHWDSGFPKNMEHVRARTDLPEEVKPKLLAENARRWYRL